MERSKLVKKYVRNWFRALVLTLLIFSVAITVTLYFKPLYYIDIGTYHLSETYGVSEDEIRKNYDALISYNTFFSDEELEFPTLPMSDQARIHFQEVKSIFLNIQWVGLICLIFLTPILTNARYKKDYDWLKYAAGLCIGLPVAAGALILVAWDKVFVWFHKLFFHNDFWIFNPETDPIIQFLPDGFFMHCAIMIVALILIGAAVCFYLYRKTLVWFPKPGATVKTEKK